MTFDKTETYKPRNEIEFPPITIVMTTYFPEGEGGKTRMKVAIETLNSWDIYIEYGGSVKYIIVDDGSSEKYAEMFFRQANQIAMISMLTPTGRGGVGRSLNLGFRQAFGYTDLVGYFVDDWALTQPFDLTPWAYLLMKREDVGVVRLGPPHADTTGKVEILTDDWQAWGLRLQRYGFAFSHRPALYHKRMVDTYGWFAEDCSALECERLYNENFCRTAGPDVVLALPHPWNHLDSIELAYLDPKEENE